jgi:chlorophyllide a reductase subunit Z
MGYAGATYIVQEVCNGMFDALFHILPLARDLDQIAATPTRARAGIPWDEEARAALDTYVDTQPVLLRISAAKQIRERVERRVVGGGGSRVTRSELEREVAGA